MRLDQYLAKQNTDYSRNFWQKAIKDGHVTVNGNVITLPKSPVSEEDQIEVSDKLPYQTLADQNIKPENIPLDIVYEDNDIVIINKPYDLVVHPAIGNYTGTLVNALVYHFKTLSNNDNRPGIVHRLDKGTSGLMVIAKNDPAHHALTKQFEERTVKKEYLTLIRGVPLKTKDTIDAPIRKDPKHYDRMKVDMYSEHAKPAVTHYEVEKIIGNKKSLLNARFCLVRCHLETGRTHQIRVHMQHIKHPIIGDAVYGYPVKNLRRQFLHAQKLSFIHPTTHEEVSFEADLPEDLQGFLHDLQV
ncbi:MAG: RluA family pseudouridine synthase [Alphaproteobacteria bacterium]|nr:MAG: RluA family pseudouridine synthase [Alphaproteobacteria bacterium]